MKTTIVSICPFETREFKPGLAKGNFYIPKAEKGEVKLLVIDDSFYDQRMAGTEQLIRVPVPSLDIAKSIIKDFSNSHIASSETAYPGMFYIEGLITETEVRTKYKDKLKAAEEAQNEWFRNLIRLADDDWEKYHNNKMISDIQRRAASYVGVDKPWNQDFNTMPLIDCPACFEKIHPDSVVCNNCKYVLNPEKHKGMQFAG